MRLKNSLGEQGSALLAWIVIGLAIMAGMMWYSHYSWLDRVSTVQHISSSRALEYADSGINAARDRLTQPDLGGFLPAGTTSQIANADAQGSYYVSLDRTNADTSLVSLIATGFFYLPKGGVLDAVNGRPSQGSVVSTKLRITNTGEYLLALPHAMTIDYGVDYSNGFIYAKDLAFQFGTTLPRTRVGRTFYTNAVSLPNPAPWVTFTQPAPYDQAVQLTNKPVFPNVGAGSSAKQYYLDFGTPLPGNVLNGLQTAPAGNIFYATGDVQIANTSDVIVQGIFIVYTPGNVHIHGNITQQNPAAMPPTDWLAIIAEQDVHIVTAAPNNLTLNASFVVGSAFLSDTRGPRGVGSQLTINGGIVAQTRIDNSTGGWGQRVYSFKGTNDAQMKLPNVAEMLDYRIIFSQ